MVSDLNMGVEIKVLPIVREKDGLAMSSRNAYLNEEERKAATVLYRALLKAKDEIIRGRQTSNGKPAADKPGRGNKSLKFIRKEITEMIESEKLARIDYIAIVNPENLQELDTIDGFVLIALAVWIGKTRLIDNIIVNLQ
jgi:pantoate--beta-alanine ligase